MPRATSAVPGWEGGVGHWGGEVFAEYRVHMHTYVCVGVLQPCNRKLRLTLTLRLMLTLTLPLTPNRITNHMQGREVLVVAVGADSVGKQAPKPKP